MKYSTHFSLKTMKAPPNLFRFLFLFLLFSMVSFFAQAQSDTRFWFAAPEVSQGHGDRPIRIVVSTFDVAATVTVTQPANLAFPTYIVAVPANTSQVIDINPSIALVETPFDVFGGLADVSRTGLLIEATAKITAYYEVNNGTNNDIFALKGKNGLGNDFYVPFQGKWRHRQGLAPNGRSGFVVVATEDATTITVTPSTNLEGGQAAGIPFNVVLNRGQTYVGSVNQPTAGNFPSGSRIQSNKPVAVTKFSDSIHTGTDASPSGCYDLAGDQLVPVNIIGREYVVLRGQLNNNELVVITATVANTEVRVNGTLVATLGIGQTHTYELSAARVFVTTSENAYVGHYAGFGCETGFAILPPVSCTGSLTSRITRSTNETFFINLMTRGAPANLNFTDNFTIRVTNGGVTTTLFDPIIATPAPAFTTVATFNQIGTSDYYATQYEFNLTQVPVGAVVTIESTTVTAGTNEAGLFHLGSVNGGSSSGTRYGYFSDFRSLDLGSDLNINYGTNTTITADIQATNFRWFSDGVLDASQTTNIFTVTDIQRRQTIRVEATVGGCVLTDEICVGTIEYVWDGRADPTLGITHPPNWSTPCGVVGIPNCTIDIIIPPTPVAFSALNVLNGQTLQVRNLSILSNATGTINGVLNVNTGGQVNVCGSMVHNGTLNMSVGSTLSFIGRGRQNYSKGTTGIGDFENLVIASDPDPTNISTFNSVIGLTILPSTNPASAQDLSVSATGSIRFQKGYITPEGFPATNGVDNSRSVIVKNPSPTAITGFAGPTNPLSPNTTSTEYFVAGKLNRAKNATGYYPFPVGVITQPVSTIAAEANKDGAMMGGFANVDWVTAVYPTGATCNPSPNGVLSFNDNTNGNNKFINFGGNTANVGVGGGAARTVEIWANVTSFNGAGLFEFGDNTVANGDFALVTINRTSVTPNSDNNWGIRLNNGFTLDLINLPNSLNNWNHYALTYNGNDADPQVAFYYNGLLIRNYSLRDAFNVPIPLTTVLTNGRVGRWRGNNGVTFRGQIDELKVWSEQRTTAQIKASFDQGCASNALQCPQANNLRAYYNFEDARTPAINPAVRTIQSRTIQCPVPVFSYQRADADFNVPNAVANVTASFKQYILVPPTTGQTGICGVDFDLDPALNNGFWNFSSFNAANAPVPVTTAYKMYLLNRDYSNFVGLSTTVMQLDAAQNPYGVSPPWTIPPGLCETNGPHLAGRSGFTGNMGFFGTAQSRDVTLLPIELLSITATPKENAILVEWATLQEKDNYGFEVFRADENGEFVKIGFVKGKDNSSTRQDYQFLDLEVQPNVNYYYKLKQIDNNGKFNFTKTVTAKLSDSDFTGEQINTIYPNPTDDEFTLYLGGKEFKNAKQIQISLVNAIGEELERKTIYSQSGNRITFRLTRYPKGMYLLRIVSETSSAVMKVVKE